MSSGTRPDDFLTKTDYVVGRVRYTLDVLETYDRYLRANGVFSMASKIEPMKDKLKAIVHDLIEGTMGGDDAELN